MRYRRLLLFFAVLFGAAALASALVPRDRGSSGDSGAPGQSRPVSTGPATTPGAGEATTAESPAAEPGTRTVAAVAANLPAKRPVQARPGELVELTVTHDGPDSVTIEGYDLVEAVDSATPARFEFPADRVGTFPVRLVQAGTQVGTLEVEP